MQKRRFFNMVEILLAMGVTAIGIAGLCAVLPVGLISSRDAYQTSCVCMMMNDIYDRLNCWCGTDFDRVIDDNYDEEWHRPTLAQNKGEANGNYGISYGFADAVDPMSLFFTSSRTKAYAKSTSNMNAGLVYNGYGISRGAITNYIYASDHWRIWPVSSSGAPDTNTEAWSAATVFTESSQGIQWKDRNNNDNEPAKDASGNITAYKETGTLEPGLVKFRLFNDFAGEVRIWKQIPSDVSGYNNTSRKKLVRVYLEFSYPSQSEYKNRTKRTFVREFYAWREQWLSKEGK